MRRALPISLLLSLLPLACADDSCDDAGCAESSGGSSEGPLTDGDVDTGEPLPPGLCLGSPCTTKIACLPGLECVTDGVSSERICVPVCAPGLSGSCDMQTFCGGALDLRCRPEDLAGSTGYCIPTRCESGAECESGVCTSGFCGA